MLINNGHPKSFWAEAVNTACYVTSRCQIRSILNKTLFELIFNKKPKFDYFRPFGCKCFILNNGKNELRKFESKSDEAALLGYSSTSKVYIVFKK